MSNSVEDYDWRILPGRKVAHAFATGHSMGFCGMTNDYPLRDLTESTPKTRRCEACLMTIVSETSYENFKFFLGYVPASIRRKRRLAWKAFLREHPQYGPPSWRDRSIGAGKR